MQTPVSLLGDNRTARGRVNPTKLIDLIPNEFSSDLYCQCSADGRHLYSGADPIVMVVVLVAHY